MNLRLLCSRLVSPGWTVVGAALSNRERSCDTKYEELLVHYFRYGPEDPSWEIGWFFFVRFHRSCVFLECLGECAAAAEPVLSRVRKRIILVTVSRTLLILVTTGSHFKWWATSYSSPLVWNFHLIPFEHNDKSIRPSTGKLNNQKMHRSKFFVGFW